MKAVVLALLATPAFAEEPTMQINPDWEYVADTVMGGVSTGHITHAQVQGRVATRLTGQVSLDNNGGFVQMAFDLQQDASDWTGVEIDVIGNGEVYELRARTDQLTRPWQSFRAEFTAPQEWTAVRIPFGDLTPRKTDATFDPAQLRRLGIVAIGREFAADIAVSGLRFYR